MVVKFSGFASGSRVTMTAGSITETAPAWGVPSSPSDIHDPYTVNGSLPALSSGDWTLVDEPSAGTNSILIDVQTAPTAPADYVLEGFHVTVTTSGGTLNRFLAHGYLTGRTRRIVTTWAGLEHSVEISPVYRDTSGITNGMDADNPAFQVYEQGPYTAAKTVTPTLGTPSVIISRIYADEVSPAAYRAKAVLTGFSIERPERELKIEWNYDDTGKAYTLTTGVTQMRGTDANTSLGPLGAHVYEFAADASPTFGPTVTVTDRAGTTYTSAADTITTVSDDSRFSASRNIFVSNSLSVGDLETQAEAVVPGSTKVQTLGAVKSQFGETDSVKVWIKAGDDFSAETTGVDPKYKDLKVIKWGAGANPILPRYDLNYVDGSEHKSISDMDILGDYDPSAPSVSDTTSGGKGLRMQNSQQTAVRVKAQGYAECFVVPDNSGALLWECTATDWSNYGILMADPGDAWFVGCNFAQNPLTIRNADGKGETDPRYADHGPARASRPDPDKPMLYLHSVFASFNSWSGVNQAQAPVRFSAGAEVGVEVWTDQCVFEGNSLFIGASSAPTATSTCDIVIANSLVMTFGTPGLSIAYGGSEMINVMMVSGDCTSEMDSRPVWALRARETLSSYDDGKPNDLPGRGLAYKQPIRFSSCSVVQLFTSANSGRIGVSETTDWDESDYTYFEDVQDTDTLFHAPLRTNGPDASPINVTETITQIYPGRVVFGENGDALQTEYKPAPAGLLPTPQAGSSAYQTGSATTGPVYDALGNLRGSNPSKGALEP